MSDAIEAYRPFWNAQRATPAARHNNSPFWELEVSGDENAAGERIARAPPAAGP
jgi:hypothetical protein